MGIGSIGMSELAVIFIIVLVFFGPRRFPEIARSMGHAMREFRRSLNQIQRELEDADPRSSIPGRDLLNDIRSGRTGKWLDPDQAATTSKPAAPAAPEAVPVTDPRRTGEAPDSGPSDEAAQLPMFDVESPPRPSREAGADEIAEPEAPTDRPAD